MALSLLEHRRAMDVFGARSRVPYTHFPRAKFLGAEVETNPRRCRPSVRRRLGCRDGEKVYRLYFASYFKTRGRIPTKNHRFVYASGPRVRSGDGWATLFDAEDKCVLAPLSEWTLYSVEANRSMNSPIDCLIEIRMPEFGHESRYNNTRKQSLTP